jgi:hypothetical protein
MASADAHEIRDKLSMQAAAARLRITRSPPLLRAAAARFATAGARFGFGNIVTNSCHGKAASTALVAQIPAHESSIETAHCYDASRRSAWRLVRDRRKSRRFVTWSVHSCQSEVPAGAFAPQPGRQDPFKFPAFAPDFL